MKHHPRHALARAVRSLPMWAKLAISGLAVAGTAVGGLAAAGATTAIPPGTIHGCVNTTQNRTLQRVYTYYQNGTTCPKGSFMAVFAGEGQFSSAESAITQNANAIATNKAGIASNTAALSKLKGVGSTTSATLQDPTAAPQSIPTGGSFVSNAVDIGTLTLGAGTYLVNFNAKATPNTDTTAQVFPQFFVYNQVKNSGFAGDLFNMGSGPLEPNSTHHDSYYSGSEVITVPASGLMLHVYAFGYDSDTGAASYALDSAAITAVQLAS